MKRQLIPLLLMLLFWFNSQGQTLKSYPVSKSTQGFALDQFENIFLLEDEELLLLDKDFKRKNSYSQPLYGDITAIDATNALNLLLYFGETYRISIIDNHLNEKLNLSLINLGFNDPKLVSVSDQRHIWVYDQSEDKIVRFSLESNERTNESLNISQIIGMENYPIQMRSVFDKVYLNVPESGILVFDALGAFKEHIPVKGISCFAINKQNIYYHQNGKIEFLNLKTGSRKTVVEYPKDVKAITVSNTKIFILTSSDIEIVKLEVPEK